MNEQTNTDGLPFNPDPLREIPLAAAQIKQFAEEAISRGKASISELELIRASAIRILAEMEVLAGGEAVISQEDGTMFFGQSVANRITAKGKK